MLNAIEINRLNLKLKPVFIGKLTIIDSLSNPAYSYDQGRFKEVLSPKQAISKDFIGNYALKSGRNIFVEQADFDLIDEKLREQLTKHTRALSIGDVNKNAKKQVNLLTMQMSSLYDNPFNDELLTNQFQNSKNLGNLLYNNKNIQKDVYHNLSKQNYHYTHKQPLLSSIMLLSYFQHLGLFTELEIQNMFLTSYFKDLGMSFIPREKFELAHLSDFDKNLFADHAENSMKLLEGRVPLSQSQLNIIKNHHFLNTKIQAMASDRAYIPEQDFISGIESVMMSSIDILVAMTHSRPYREAKSSFQSLELLKKVLADEYSQEFKTLVFFLKNFLTK